MGLFHTMVFWMIWFDLMIGVLFLIHNVISIRKTELVLAGNGLRQKRVSCREAWRRFFLRIFDYKSRASLSEFWWVVLPMKIVFLIWFCLSYVLFHCDFIVLGSILCILFVIFVLPLLSLLVRRFKDVGMGAVVSIFLFAVTVIANGGLILGDFTYTMTGFPDLFMMILGGTVAYVIFVTGCYQASAPYKNLYGDIPNTEPLAEKKPAVKRVTPHKKHARRSVKKKRSAKR